MKRFLSKRYLLFIKGLKSEGGLSTYFLALQIPQMYYKGSLTSRSVRYFNLQTRER